MIKKLFTALLPPARPEIEQGPLYRIAAEAGVNLETENCLIGVRGFFNQEKNQRGIYDDAIFLITPKKIIAFNANTDPSAFKKGIATLICGTWIYRLGIHGLSKPKSKQYEALVQGAVVTVTRDGVGKDTGLFGINIHRGGRWGTSSLGCQTIHPSQWDEFINAVKTCLVQNKQTRIKYILKEMVDDLD